MTQGQTRGQFPRKRRCDEGSKTWAWRGQTDWAPQIRTNLYEICVASNLTRNLWQLLNTAQYGLAPCECVPLSDDSRVRKWVLPSTRGGCLWRRSEHQHAFESLCRRHEKGRRASSNYSAATWAESRIWKVQVSYSSRLLYLLMFCHNFAVCTRFNTLILMETGLLSKIH